jgi:hypothetical protein
MIQKVSPNGICIFKLASRKAANRVNIRRSFG